MLKTSAKFRRYVTASQNHPDRKFRFRKDVLIRGKRRTYHFLVWCTAKDNSLTITAQRTNNDVYTYSLPLAEIPEQKDRRKYFLDKIWRGMESKVTERHPVEAV
jgi:hypothetical protein